MQITCFYRLKHFFETIEMVYVAVAFDSEKQRTHLSCQIYNNDRSYSFWVCMLPLRSEAKNRFSTIDKNICSRCTVRRINFGVSCSHSLFGIDEWNQRMLSKMFYFWDKRRQQIHITSKTKNNIREKASQTFSYTIYLFWFIFGTYWAVFHSVCSA